MKKHLLKTLLVGIMTFMATGAWAADPDLTNDYTLVKSVEWGDGTSIAGTVACAYTAYDTGNKKQQSLTILTAPEAAAGWIAMQAWTDGSGKGWWNRSEKGLYCVNAGRSACVFGDDLTTGWLVVFECTSSASSVITLTNASGDPDGTFSYVASEDGQKYFCTITAAENAYVGFCGNKNAGFISKISVYKPNKAVVLTTYTVNYVDMDGNTLKEAVTYDAVGGAEIALSDADKANITVGDDTYVYDSDDTEGKTVAEDGSSVVTVKFHKAQNFNYVVNEMCGGTAARVTEGVSYETATVIAPYRKYNAVGGQLYTKGATSKEYNYRFSLTQDNQVENIDYEAVSGVDNVVFLTEGEDVTGLTPCNSANTAIRSSNSASAFASEDVTITTLAAGKYKIHAIIYDASKNPDSHWVFNAGLSQIADFNCTTVNIQEFDSEEFAIGKETPIIMAAGGSNNMGLDMLYIVKTGDVTPEEAAALNAAAALAEAKAALEDAIAQATALNVYANDANLTTAITDAQAALASDEMMTIASAGLALKNAATTAARNTLQKAVDLGELLGLNVTDAKDLLADNNATAEDMAAALKAIATEAIPAAQTALGQVKAFFEAYDGTAATALADDFTDVENALTGTDLDAMKSAVTTLITDATPYAKTALEKVIGYVEKMGDETIDADVTAAKTAIESGKIMSMIAAANQLKADFPAAAKAYLLKVNAIAEQGAAEGKNGVEELKLALATATAAITAEGATVVQIGEAIRELILAVEAYEQANAPAEDIIALTADMFFTWDGYGADANKLSPANVDFNVGVEQGTGAMVAGTSTVDYLTYADLTGCTKMIFEGTAGVQLRVLMNRQESNSGPLVEKNPAIGEDGTAELDLTDLAYVHLNAIKTGWGSPTGTITAIKLVKPNDPLAVPKEALKNAIAAAKLQSPVAKTEESFAALTTAIADAEAALAAEDATEESLATAKQALEDAVAGLTLAEGYSELTREMFQNHTEQGGEGTPTGCAYDLFVTTGMPYGDGNVYWLNYADLTEYSKLIVTMASGAPRFCLNRTVDGAQDNDDPETSPFIDIPGHSWGTEAYETVDGNTYTIDLAKLVADKGIAYLHSIKGAGGAQIIVTGMYLFKEAAEVFPSDAIVYDFEAAAAAGENPANKNGSAGNGQAFYGWENPEKTDSKRQDYKGYEWAEGSVLLELCHVWRRSDRINGNVKDGGLYCPSDKEMAIDGLTPYSKVIIVYDAENATNKNIIWAIGDGTSEGGPGTVRATATIDGVEAVTGETTIASGAEIVLKSVTPAEHGTGYIVFQVKKGMVIQQIAIVPMNEEWANAIAAAQALADEDGVAVGKLIAAINEAQAITEPTDEQKAALQAAVEQYTLDNADQEKDETAKVATNGWKKFDGSAAGVCATQFAPAITTYDGRTAQMAECYETNGNRTGTIIYQDITGLTNGKYKVGFYGNAFSTSGRDGFECTMEDGATDVAYVFANEEKEYISARIATSTTENDFRQFDVEVTDGNIKLGMGKDTEKSTNWHTIQIYQLTWFTTAKEVYAADQTDLAALVTEAEALVADETKTEGKDALAITLAIAEEAITDKANWYNITEIEEIIAGLEKAIADFKKANIIIPEGKYYLIAMALEDNNLMAAGKYWGTQGIVNGQGLDLEFIYVDEAEAYNIETRIHRDNTNHFLGSNLYMDSPAFNWSVEEDASYGHCIYAMFEGVKKYIAVDYAGNLELSETP